MGTSPSLRVVVIASGIAWHREWPQGDGALCLQVGSFGNGTVLRSSAEVELVVFLSCFHSFQQEAKHHQAVLRMIWKKLWTCQDLLALGLEVLGVLQGVPDALTFTIQTRGTAEPVTVTIVPAYRALGKGKGSPPDSHICPSQEAGSCLTFHSWPHSSLQPLSCWGLVTTMHGADPTLTVIWLNSGNISQRISQINM